MYPSSGQFFLLILAIALALPKIAMADHLDAFVQVTCVPDLRYFAIRTFHIWDTKAVEENAVAAKVRIDIKKEGVFTLTDLANQGFRCVLPPHDISLQVISHTGGRGLEYARLELRIDTQSVYSFDAYGLEKSENTVHQVEISSVNESKLVDCAYPDGELLSPGGTVVAGKKLLAASCNVINF